MADLIQGSIVQLECGCNNYPWGKKGKESLAAKYAAATPGGHFKLDESKEYAEVCSSLLIWPYSSRAQHINSVELVWIHCGRP